MYPQGHLAVNLILIGGIREIAVRLGNGNEEEAKAVPWMPALAAAIFPDLVDKVVCDYWHLAQYGRSWTHNLTAVALFSLAAWAVTGRKGVGLSWAVGHLGHLIGDFAFVPWFWPWVPYVWPRMDHPIAPAVVATALDLLSGSPLDPEVRSIWDGPRLVFETAFLLFAVSFSLLRQDAWKRRFLLGSIALWAGIVVFCDLGALVTSLAGLKTGG